MKALAKFLCLSTALASSEYSMLHACCDETVSSILTAGNYWSDKVSEESRRQLLLECLDTSSCANDAETTFLPRIASDDPGAWCVEAAHALECGLKSQHQGRVRHTAFAFDDEL